MVEIRNIGLSTGQKITVWGHTLHPKYVECKDGIIDMSANHANAGVILVPDEVVDEASTVYSCFVGNYVADSKAEKIEVEQEIWDITRNSEASAFISFNTRLDIAEAAIGIGALVTFIGLYLGIVFLIASASILALKELSESADNRERYGMLRKLGTDEKMLNKALFRQIGSFFLFPLILALIHSIFGLKFCNEILETFGNEQLGMSLVMTMAVLIVIYGGYFVITYYCSKNIIKEK